MQNKQPKLISKIPQVFNPDGNDSIKRVLIDDEVIEKSTGLANLNLNNQSWIKEWRDRVSAKFWRPEEISMLEDKRQFPDLPKEIRETFENVISFLILLDSIVPKNSSDIVKVVGDEEIETGLYWHIFFEGIHRDSYQYILKSIYGEDDSKINSVYLKFKSFKPLLERNYAITRDFQKLKELVAKGILSYDDNINNIANYDRKLAERIIFRSIVQDLAIEGVVFFVGFMTFHIFAYKLGILQGSNQQITQIKLDEVEHIPFFAGILREWKEQGYYYNEDEVKEIFYNSAMADIKFYTEAVADRIPLMTQKNIEDYIKTLTDERLKFIGVNPLFNVNRNPFEDIEKLLMQDKTSFFETGAIDYSHIPVSIEDINGAFDE